MNRRLTESTAGKFNGAVILISSSEVRVLLQRKLLQTSISAESRHYPEGFTDKEDFWTSVYSIPRVIAYNTKLVRPDAVPKSYDEQLATKLEKQFRPVR